MELKTKTFLFVILSFLLGGVAGGFIGKTYFANAEDGRHPGRAEFRKQFAERVKLNPVQAVQVDSILESSRNKFGAIQQQYSEVFKLHRDTVRLEIRKLLSAEQNKLYDGFIKELEEREAKRRENEKRD